MTFTENNGTKTWVCDHCHVRIGETDSDVLFYKGRHFHLHCYTKGKEYFELYKRIIASNSEHDYKGALCIS